MKFTDILHRYPRVQLSYEKIIDDAADKIESFIEKANSDNQIQ